MELCFVHYKLIKNVHHNIDKQFLEVQGVFKETFLKCHGLFTINIKLSFAVKFVYLCNEVNL